VRAVSTALGNGKLPRGDGNAYGQLVEAVLRIRPGAPHAVVEIGIDGPGQMAAYAKMLRPDITVVTSIGSEHNRGLGTLETTRYEKAEMVRCLFPSDLVVLNGDDPNVLWMRSQTKARVITFGFDEANDVQGSDVSLTDWPNGTRFTVHTEDQNREMQIQLLGRPNVYSALAATAVATAEGFTMDDIQRRLGDLAPYPGRLQPVPLTNGATILRDDFKSPLETIEAALDVLSQIPARRRIIVLGHVAEPQGKQGDIYRSLGERVSAVADQAIFLCAKNNSCCRAGAIKAGMSPDAITKAGRSIVKAVGALRGKLGPGDVVLIKGARDQHLERITLALQGCNVRCQINYCGITDISCPDCPLL
jgi:UDP-N-acetylmuramoyl-tripeptide--D-alanyl-D-alanine ligase